MVPEGAVVELIELVLLNALTDSYSNESFT
jgi:hypothetical protein